MYGWLSPKGEFYECNDYYIHEEFASDHAYIFNNTWTNTCSTALEDCGWIKIKDNYYFPIKPILTQEQRIFIDKYNLLDYWEI